MTRQNIFRCSSFAAFKSSGNISEKSARQQAEFILIHDSFGRFGSFSSHPCSLHYISTANAHTTFCQHRHNTDTVTFNKFCWIQKIVCHNGLQIQTNKHKKSIEYKIGTDLYTTWVPILTVCFAACASVRCRECVHYCRVDEINNTGWELSCWNHKDTFFLTF